MFNVDNLEKIDINVSEILWTYEHLRTSPWVYDTAHTRIQHNVNEFAIRYIIDGGYKLKQGNKPPVSINKGALMLQRIISERCVSTSVDLPFKYHSIFFKTDNKSQEIFLPEGIYIIYPKNPKYIEELFKKALNIFTENPASKNMLIKSIVYELLSQLVDDYSRHKTKIHVPEVIREGVEYIDKNALIHKINIADVAAQNHISTEYFIRLFKKTFGVSPKKYIYSIKLERAVILLKTTDKSISEICELAGFNDVPYFNKIFKLKYNAAPTEYRKNHSNFIL